MRIATWNINSIKARLPLFLSWLDEVRPDIVCLQEIKCQTADFPMADIEKAGYHAVALGQKSYNGVAILSRFAIEDVTTGLPDPGDDEQARFLEATCGGVRVACLYLPNGNPVESEKYPYKLAWMDRLIAHARTALTHERPYILAGDYNICPTDHDVYDPAGWRDDALCRPESREKFRALLHLGYTEAFQALHPHARHAYSFWDYQAGRWPRDEGVRIDHFLLSPEAADRLVACEIDRKPRGADKASDHTPVICTLTDQG